MSEAVKIGSLLLLLLVPVEAAFARAASPRYRFHATLDNERVPDALVCFAQASFSGSILEQMMSSPAPGCLPADVAINLPPGAWMFHVRTAGGSAMSTHPFKIRQSRESDPNGPIRTINIPVVAAAELEIEALQRDVKRDERIFLFVANHISGAPDALIPIEPHASTVLVPVDTPIRVLVTKSFRIVRTTDELVVTQGKPTVAEEFTKRRIHIIPVALRDLTPHEVAMPMLRVVDAMTEAEVLTAYVPARGLVFASLPDGEYEAATVGEGWRSPRVRVNVSQSDKLEVTADLLFTRASEEPNSRK